MSKTKCFNHNCKNTISPFLPRKLFYVYEDTIILRYYKLKFEQIDYLILNYDFEKETSNTIWLPTKNNNIIEFSPFCCKSCAENFIINHSNENKRVIVYSRPYEDFLLPLKYF